MSKKSYKQQQNRLYREIMKRIIAEKALARERCERNRFSLNPTERVRTKRNIQAHEVAYMEMIKREMAHEIGEFLMNHRYINYEMSAEWVTPDGYMPNGIEIQADLYVVRN